MSMELTTGRLESRLGATLRIGTWVASAVIASGLVWPVFYAAGGKAIVMTGIAIIITLPVVRVALMFSAFVKARDFRFVAVAAVVLLMIGLGVLAGLNSAIRP
jgi:uncharacterized membrane protein